jgi:N-formylglutamate amidohydrolase
MTSCVLLPLPEFVVLHIPHDSLEIPPLARAGLSISDSDLALEISKLTDHETARLFAQGVPSHQVVRAPVSRLVVDCERFVEDKHEPMVSKGMGAVYMRGFDGGVLRQSLTDSERQSLLDTWYWPHHDQLFSTTQSVLDQYGHVLVVDAHSFSATRLPYELTQEASRPDICIGTDSFHTSKSMEDAFVKSFRDVGAFSVRVNEPFGGALVPLPFLGEDKKVSALMIEVNRSLYWDEVSGTVNASFEEVAFRIRNCLCAAIALWETSKKTAHVAS